MHRRFQFSLRTLFVVTALAAFLSGAIPPVVLRYAEYRQRVADEKMEAWVMDQLSRSRRCNPLTPCLGRIERPSLSSTPYVGSELLNDGLVEFRD